MSMRELDIRAFGEVMQALTHRSLPVEIVSLQFTVM